MVGKIRRVYGDKVNPFDKYEVQNISLKGDLSILSAIHQPEEFPHRDEQINIMVASLSGIMRGFSSNNILVYGKTGTGKTSITRYVTGMLKEKIGDRITACYVNCQTYDSPYSILINIAKSFPGSDNIPPSGWTLDRIYDELVNKIKGSKKTLILTLDEIDKLVEKNGGDSLYIILKLMGEDVGIGGTIIGITNDSSFYEKLDPRVKSRMSRESVMFTPYNADQLKDILRPRVEKVLYKENYDEAAIGLCAAIGAREHGDARKAIDLMRISIEMAVRESAIKINVDHVYRARDTMEIDVIRETVKTLPIHSKMVLMAVIVCGERHPNSATTGEVSSLYSDLCREVGIQPLTSRRVSDYISDLEDFGMINTTVKSLGRYGRTRYIRITGRENDLKRFILEDQELEPLKNIKNTKQFRLDENI
ncbi:MAG: Cdc6/Cdc18 family protein [Cuniculiplasma sp.]